MCDALRGTTGEGTPEGESGGGRLSCLLLICFLFCAVTHTARPSFHCSQYLQNLVPYNGLHGAGAQQRTVIQQGLHHTEPEKQEQAVAGTQRQDLEVARDAGSWGLGVTSPLEMLRNIRKGLTYVHV